MKQLCIYLILALSIHRSYAVSYYVSSSYGNDAYSAAQAQHPETPWKSLTKLNAFFHTFKDGDSILFKRNDIFYGSLAAVGNGTHNFSLSFGTYGLGKDPVISGLKTIGGWIKIKDNVNVWKVNCPGFKTVNNLLINGNPQDMGRFPNLSDLNKGYLSIKAHDGKFKISTNYALDKYNWQGAEAVVRSKRWILDRTTIKKHSGNTLEFSDPLTYEPGNNFGFFIQDHLNTLDQQNEWFFDEDSKDLYLYSTKDPSLLLIQLSAADVLLSFLNLNNITVKGIIFNGAGKAAIKIQSCSNVKLNKLSVINSGVNAIDVHYSNHIDITKCRVNKAYNNGISIVYSTAVNLKHNTLTNISTVAGMGLGGDIQYMAINVSGSNNLIDHNTIDSTGYIAIYFDGENYIVQNNQVSNFCLVKDDGGGIYSFSNNVPTFKNRTIVNNIITNGVGRAEGTPYSTPFASGIYLDDNASNIIVKNNTISGCGHSGLYVRNASNTTITQNLIFDNGVQLKFFHDEAKNTIPISHTIVQGNTFISRYCSQALIDINLYRGQVEDIGTFERNHYIIPCIDSSQVRIESRKEKSIERQLFTLRQWQKHYHKDFHSKFTSLPFAPFIIQSVNPSNLITSWLDAWSSHDNISTLPLDSDRKELSITFNHPINTQVDAIGAIFTNTFGLESGKQYAVHFSLHTTLPGKNIYIKIREDKNSTHVALEDFVIANATITSYWKVFTSNVNYDSARIYFELSEDTSRTSIGNTELYEIQYAAQDVFDVLQTYTNATDSLKTIQLNNKQLNRFETMPTDTFVLQAYSSAIGWKNLEGVQKSKYHQVLQSIEVKTVAPWMDITNQILFILIIFLLLFYTFSKKKYFLYAVIVFIVLVFVKIVFYDEPIKVLNTGSIILGTQDITINDKQYAWQDIKQVRFSLGKQLSIGEPYSENINNYFMLAGKNGEQITQRFVTKNLKEVGRLKQIIDLWQFYSCPTEINNDDNMITD